MKLWEGPTVMPHYACANAISSKPEQTSHSSAEVAKSCANLNGTVFALLQSTLIRPVAEILNGVDQGLGSS